MLRLRISPVEEVGCTVSELCVLRVRVDQSWVVAAVGRIALYSQMGEEQGCVAVATRHNVCCSLLAEATYIHRGAAVEASAGRWRSRIF